MNRKKELSEAQRRWVVETYTAGGPGIGLKMMAARCRVCIHVIRRTLVENGIVIRRIGRPNKTA